MTAFMAPSTRAGPLHDAIVAEDMNRVRAEIVSGADVNEEVLLQGLPLMVAAQIGQIEIAALLLTHGANVNAKDVTGTPLHTAAFAGHAERSSFLLVRALT